MPRCGCGKVRDHRALLNISRRYHAVLEGPEEEKSRGKDGETAPELEELRSVDCDCLNDQILVDIELATWLVDTPFLDSAKWFRSEPPEREADQWSAPAAAKAGGSQPFK